jgi:phosphoribosylformimino-5-aminoimidazole carboxamide ribotide isomerase
MIVIPAVDILGGKCVQLVGGKPETAKAYGDPLDIALDWEKKGAEAIHVVDLDAALGSGDNLDSVHKICEAVHVPVQFGGGIRTETYARIVLNAGISRIIMGSAAVKDPGIVKNLSKEFGKDRIMVALDSLGGSIVIKGWTEDSGLKTKRLIKELKDYVFGFLVTDVDREGLMQGIDLEEFKSLAETGARICASGGISSTDDIKSLEKEGIWGCVVGKALYEGRIKLFQ